MKYQEKSHTCGLASIVNGMRCKGIRTTENKINRWAKTTKGGTDEKGMQEALSRLGCVLNVINGTSGSECWAELYDYLLKGCPVILCVDQSTHWVVAGGLIGDLVIVFDSGTNASNMRENGVAIKNKKQLLSKWRDRSRKYYGIVIVR